MEKIMLNLMMKNGEEFGDNVLRAICPSRLRPARKLNEEEEELHDFSFEEVLILCLRNVDSGRA